MTTVIHFECRNAVHLATRSRAGIGGIVMHHGTFGYCDGFASDGDHRWIPTGGVFLEQLIHCTSRADGTFRLEHEDASYSGKGGEESVKLSDDPYWPDTPRPTADPFLFFAD
jgi:hypothetical protein